MKIRSEDTVKIRAFAEWRGINYKNTNARHSYDAASGLLQPGRGQTRYKTFRFRGGRQKVSTVCERAIAKQPNSIATVRGMAECFCSPRRASVGRRADRVQDAAASSAGSGRPSQRSHSVSNMFT